MGRAAALAFTRHAEHTVVLEIDGPRSKRMLTFYAAVWERLRALGIPVTFHWGKLLPLDAAATDGYGADCVEAWRAARS